MCDKRVMCAVAASASASTIARLYSLLVAFRGDRVGYSIDRTGGSERERGVLRVLGAVLVLNLLVAAAKLVYGSATGAVSMVADGFHSLFDGASNVIGLVGASLASRPADETHPYGHGKYETWASVAIGTMLAAAAWSVGRAAVVRLLGSGAEARVGVGSFAVMIGTLTINVAVTLYERRAGKRLGSEVLLADASHTASDVLVSLGVIAGLAAVRLGYPQADSIIALFVAGMIARAAWQVFRRAERTFSDRARLPVEDICRVVYGVDGVLSCHDVRTRGTMSEVYVDLHVQVDKEASLQRAHGIAETVEKALCEEFAEIADAIVHIEPLDDYQADKSASQAEPRA
jgi:cation diffusion facilitator family transporter